MLPSSAVPPLAHRNESASELPVLVFHIKWGWRPSFPDPISWKSFSWAFSAFLTGEFGVCCEQLCWSKSELATSFCSAQAGSRESPAPLSFQLFFLNKHCPMKLLHKVLSLLLSKSLPRGVSCFQEGRVLFSCAIFVSVSQDSSKQTFILGWDPIELLLPCVCGYIDLCKCMSRKGLKQWEIPQEIPFLNFLSPLQCWIGGTF